MTDVLYYDGQCPLCIKEISVLERIADSHLVLHDIHKLELDAHRRTTMLKVLHLQRNGRTWLTGVDATVAAWSHTRYARLFAILNWPVLRFFSHRLYRYWARKRYEKRYRCDRCVSRSP